MADRSATEVFDIVRANIVEVLPDVDGNSISREDRLVDLGANSVDRAEIVTLSLEALALRIPRTELASVRNIGDLVDELHARAHG